MFFTERLVLFGRYIAACTWYERNVIGNLFAPASLTETEIRIAQEAAHRAVINPDRITAFAD